MIQNIHSKQIFIFLKIPEYSLKIKFTKIEKIFIFVKEAGSVRASHPWCHGKKIIASNGLFQGSKTSSFAIWRSERPKWVEHCLNQVIQCISHLRGPAGPLLTHQKWPREVMEGFKVGNFCPRLAIGGPSCPKWAERQFNKVEHCIPHLGGGQLDVPFFYPSKMAPGGSQKAHKRGISGHTLLYTPSVVLAGLDELNSGGTRLNIVSHTWGGQLDSFRPIRNGPRRPQKAAFGCIWLFG